MVAVAVPGNMRWCMTMPAVAVPMRVVRDTALTFQLPIIVTDTLFGFDPLLVDCSSLVGIVASQISHLSGVSSDVIAPGTAVEASSGTFEIGSECIALRLVPVPQFFLGVPG